MRRAVLLLCFVVGWSLALVRAYTVEPRTQTQSGWTSLSAPNNRVSEIVTCCWDELDSSVGAYVELFVGERGSGGAYKLEIVDADSGQTVAEQEAATQGDNHSWLPFDEIAMRTGQSFTKGKQYEFRFTRSGSDSINYYYPQGMRDEGGGMNRNRGSRATDLPEIAA